MIRFDSWYLPDGETHLPEWMTTVNDRKAGRYRYQGSKYDAALAVCPRRRLAVDVGAHVGLFSYWLAQDFARVFAFEPHPAHQDCWRKNMDGHANAALFCYALGAHPGDISLTTGPSSSGDTFVQPEALRPGAVRAQMRRLDEFNLVDLDFLKIDCEGFEYFVLQGATETILRCRPVVLVEQKPRHGAKYGIADTAGAEFLTALGYRTHQVISGDVILYFPEAA